MKVGEEITEVSSIFLVMAVMVDVLDQDAEVVTVGSLAVMAGVVEEDVEMVLVRFNLRCLESTVRYRITNMKLELCRN